MFWLQVEYAATDAAIAVDIFLSMVFDRMRRRAYRNERLLRLSHTPCSLDTAVDPLHELTASNDIISEESDRENLYSLCFMRLADSFKWDDVCGRKFPTEFIDIFFDNEKKTIWRCARSLCQGLVEAVYAHESKGGNLVSSSSFGSHILPFDL